MRLSALLLILVPSLLLAAEPAPRVKVELSPSEGVWVGQRVNLIITLYTPDFFAGVPNFEIPPLPNLIVIPPAGSPSIGSETIGDTSFTTQRHEIALYPTKPGEVSIPTFAITFESNAGFGKPTIQRQVTTTPASFSAKAPPGAEGLGIVIATRKLKVEDHWKPDTTSAKQGDAFTREITITAEGVPGMVFPPLLVDEINGLAAYPKQPVVNDRTDRGDMIGQRTESTTYICEQAGTLVVPERTLTWFDLDTKLLKTEKLAGRSFEVAEGPPPAPTTSTPVGPSRGRGQFPWKQLLILAAIALGSGFAWKKGWPRWKAFQARQAESEQTYFHHLMQATHNDNPQSLYIALLNWLDRIGPMTLDEFSHRANDPRLTQLLSDLQSHVYGSSSQPTTWPLTHELTTHLTKARKNLLRPVKQLQNALPPLNP